MPVNPFDNAIISQSILAAAREMGIKLIRSAYSTILREASDGSAAIANVRGAAWNAIRLIQSVPTIS
jgi:N-methylhydantoinase B